MAGRQTSGGKSRRNTEPGRVARAIRRVRRWLLLVLGAAVLLLVGGVVLFAHVNPPWGLYMIGEYRRTGEISRTWVPMDAISPHMARSAVAAEDANFCNHWGFDMAEIRRALESGGARGASTITQQTVKNVYLWHGRTWTRKAFEAGLTPIVELVWSKRRILEVYLNVAEFGDGVFGVEAAAQQFFGVSASALTATQAARLAAVLPNPKARDPARPSDWLRGRAASIMDGAATIRADGRAACFED
jgi:monofunctional biosynthetic peptidoglycan transglycosylase